MRDYLTVHSYQCEGLDNEYVQSLVRIHSTEEIAPFLGVNYERKVVAPLSYIFQSFSVINDVSGISTLHVNKDKVSTGITIDATSSSLASGLNYTSLLTYGNDPHTSHEAYQYNGYSGVRGVGFRAPYAMVGWGLTTDGMPFPSNYDEYKYHSGRVGHNPTLPQKFIQQSEFASGHQNRNDIWGAGHLDVRWDRYKEMWIAAPNVVCGYAIEDIGIASGRYAPTSYSSGQIEVAFGRYNEYFLPSGRVLHNIINRSRSAEIASGTFVVAMRTNNGEYLPIWVDCEPDISGVS